MASLPSSKSKHLPCKITMTFALLLVLFVGFSSATRIGKSMVIMVDEEVSVNLEHTNTFDRRKQRTSFRYKDQIFSFFPKGVPIPPSGPSKRHNEVVNSTPPN